MSQRNVINSNCGLVAGNDITCNLLKADYGLQLPSVDVVQATSETTPVVANGASGEIECFTSTLAAGGSAIFTVSNNILAAGDKVLLNIVDYSGSYLTNGLPMCQVDNITANSFQIVKLNAHAVNALAGVVKVQFQVIKS